MKATTAAWAVYDVIAGVVAGSAVADAKVDAAATAPPATWAHVLALEGCAAWLDGERRRTPAVAAVLAPAVPLLREAAVRSVRNAVAGVHQLSEILSVAADVGARVLLLKGAARLVGGEPAGRRTMADIDLLVAGDASALHAAMQDRLGYTSDEPGTPARHLPSLVRADSLPVEIHRRLGDQDSWLDDRIWDDARRVVVAGHSAYIPRPTAFLMHTIEHAVVTHRATRYRLRDVLDIATAMPGADAAAIGYYIDAHRNRGDRQAIRTLLATAGKLVPGAGDATSLWHVGPMDERRAWRRVRRVGRARLLAPARDGVVPQGDPRVLVLSQLAQGSPSGVLRLAVRALAAPARAVGLIAGTWLPVEARHRPHRHPGTKAS